jgi:hypothetical protein
VSADNYRTCPRCLHRELEALVALKAKVDAAYGHAPHAEYTSMHNELVRRTATAPKDTFGEYRDFDLNADNLTLKASYYGECGDCGLKVEFEETVPVNIGEPTQEQYQ